MTEGTFISMDHLVRFGERRDALRIAEIDSRCFSEPDSLSVTEKLLDDPAVKFLVLEVDGEVVSYCSALFVLDEVQIINVATLPGNTSKGYGSEVLGGMLSYAADVGAVSASLEVRCSNTTAIKLYKGHGFEAVGVRRGFYRIPSEDAIVMTAQILKK